MINSAGVEEAIPLPRPLHIVQGIPAVTYKKRLWPVAVPGIVDQRKAKPFPEGVKTRPATRSEMSGFVAKDGGMAKPADLGKAGAIPAGVPKAANPPGEVKPAKPPTQPAALPAPQLDDSTIDDSQKEVVRLAANARALINAGPGTGKTAVICARVKYLVETLAVPAGRICLISFTRTAVQEIRERVARLTDRHIANTVTMATLDSLAGRLNNGVARSKAARSFDENIRSLIGNLESQVIGEYFRDLRHVFIDEAQDIVGDRAELLLKIVSKLPPECGITILSDDAQAIYGFATADADDQHKGEDYQSPLPERIRESTQGSAFKTLVLDTIHRTADPNLKKIFSDVRKDVLGKTGTTRERYERVRSEILRLAHGEAPKDTVELAGKLPDDSFVLYRRRIDAIAAVARLRRAGIPHRLRFSGLPVVIAPWIAAALGECTEPRIGEKAFAERWAKHVANTSLASLAPDAAFKSLCRVASDASGRLVDLRALRDVLATRPPSSLTSTELGAAGPILGTIHACKGREASSVVLFLPSAPKQDEADAGIAEEARVLFVGATRARAHLQTASGSIPYASNTSKGRAYFYSVKQGKRLGGMEVGRLGDIGPEGLVNKSLFSVEAVRQNQKKWLELCDSAGVVSAFKSKSEGDEWNFCLKQNYGDNPLGTLTGEVDADLGRVVASGKRRFDLSTAKKPGRLDNLAVVGMTTYAVSPDSPVASQLLEPWRTSGLVLGPVLYGFSWFNLKEK